MDSKLKAAIESISAIGPMVGDPNAAHSLSLLLRARATFEEAGKYFFAGYVLERAVHAAWGDGDAVAEVAIGSYQDYLKCWDSFDSPLELRLAACTKAVSALRQCEYLTSLDIGFVRTQKQLLLEERANILLKYVAGEPHARHFLVQGFLIRVNADETFELQFPEYEVDAGVSSFSWAAISFAIPGAFTTLMSLEDYQGAVEVAEKAPEGFCSPGLRGWRAAALGHIDTRNARRHYEEASREFGSDVSPNSEELQKRGGSWSSVNRDLWAKYYKAKSLIEAVRDEPAAANRLLSEAENALRGTESGWHSGAVSRLHILLRGLNAVLAREDSPSLEEIQRKLEIEARISGDAESSMSLRRFLTLSTKASADLRSDPGNALLGGELGEALDLLGKLPDFDEQIAMSVRPAVKEAAWQKALGPINSWIHSSLEAIKDERVLQRVLLRLLRAAMPLYAQITHGPIEYGKDLISVTAGPSGLILSMYQLKVGPLDKAKWEKARAEVEEIFLVEPNLPPGIGGIVERRAFIVVNSHPNPYTMPLVTNWISEQARVHNRQIEFLHLDRLANYVSQHRLFNELRIALSENGVAV